MLRYGVGLTDTVRMGMAVSRRVSLRAVERNRIKRQIRESYRHRRADLPPVDILVIAYRDASGQPACELRRDLEALWSRVKALKDVSTTGTMKD